MSVIKSTKGEEGGAFQVDDFDPGSGCGCKHEDSKKLLKRAKHGHTRLYLWGMLIGIHGFVEFETECEECESAQHWTADFGRTGSAWHGGRYCCSGCFDEKIIDVNRKVTLAKIKSTYDEYAAAHNNYNLFVFNCGPWANGFWAEIVKVITA
mmetsp:Transcript_33238/g.71248  ORF Transcript_33238/g.71248 Transcript_33238/m.71248 type:complete len:152 (+) Transcript_33238:88-543(+)